MISFIRGTLEEVSGQGVVIDNGGMGYRVSVSPQTAARLPGVGGEIKVHTYMHVKEDGIALYGFLSREEINIFNLLILVSGVGPKVALGILGAMEPNEVMLAIITDDFAALAKAPGVGKKTAQRIALELKDRIKGAGEMFDMAEGQRSIAMSLGTGMGSNEKQDAIDALLALGYSRGESVKAVMETALPEMGSGQIIKAALKKLARFN